MAEPNPSSHGATSLSLLDRARGGIAVQLYRPLVFSGARPVGLGEGDAADLVQEVRLSVAAALHQPRKMLPFERGRGAVS